MGLTELTVNSCFFALSSLNFSLKYQKFTSSLCAFTFIFFAIVSKKILKKVLHLKYFIYLRNQIPILLTPS